LLNSFSAVIKSQVFGAVFDNLEKAEMNPRQLYHEAAKIIIRALLNSDGIIHVSTLREMAKVEPSKLLDGMYLHITLKIRL